MLRRRVIPCLDVANGRVVKGTRFVDLVDEGDPPELAERYARGGRRRARLPRHHRRARGPRDAPRHRRADRPPGVHPAHGRWRGPERRRHARRPPGRRGQGLAQHGRGRGPDAGLPLRRAVRAAGRRRGDRRPPGPGRRRDEPRWEVVVKGGRESTGLDAVAWAERVVDLGAGELLVTSIDRDGTRSGFDTALLRVDRGPRPGAGHRVRWRRRARTTSWPRSATAAPTRSSPPRSSIAASTRSRRSSGRWPRPACRSASSRRPRHDARAFAMTQLAAREPSRSGARTGSPR